MAAVLLPIHRFGAFAQRFRVLTGTFGRLHPCRDHQRSRISSSSYANPHKESCERPQGRVGAQAAEAHERMRVKPIWVSCLLRQLREIERLKRRCCVGLLLARRAMAFGGLLAGPFPLDPEQAYCPRLGRSPTLTKFDRTE